MEINKLVTGFVLLLVISLTSSASTSTIHTRVVDITIDQYIGENDNYTYFRITGKGQVLNTMDKTQEIRVDEYTDRIIISYQLENKSLHLDFKVLGLWEDHILINDMGYNDLKPGITNETTILDIRINDTLQHLPDGIYNFQYISSIDSEVRHNSTLNVTDGIYEFSYPTFPTVSDNSSVNIGYGIVFTLITLTIVSRFLKYNKFHQNN